MKFVGASPLCRLNHFHQLPATPNCTGLDAFGHDRQAPIRVLLAFEGEIIA